MVIKKEQIEGFLTSSCPSFKISEEFREWREDWGDEAEPPYYCLSSAFVRHLTHLNALKKYEEFPDVFALIEELHLQSDDYVKEWATIGVLEDLQNKKLHPPGSEPNDFARLLGPESKWWWDEVGLFWSGKIKSIGSSDRPHSF